MKQNVEIVVKDGLCTGCGLCQDSCSRNFIKIKHGVDVNYPIVDQKKCIECGVCLKVCTGHKLNIKEKAQALYMTSGSQLDVFAGYTHSCFAGYSNNSEIRFHSASGGCVSTFLIFLLEHGYINGAVVVGFSSESLMKPHAFIAKTKEEILQTRSSKYCVVSFEKIITQILKEKGLYAVVGLPCHIHAYRQYESVFKMLKKHVFGYFSIYCSSNRTMRSQDYLIYRYGIKRKDVSSFVYRDNGCLGSMYFRNNKGETIKSIPYEHFWIGMRGFFNVPRCSLCIDHYGELADICFGDIHIDKYMEDHIGVNSIISRSMKWTNLLKQAETENYISLEQISLSVINKSQAYAMRQKKGKGITAAYKIRSVLGKHNPKYDVQLVAKADTISIMKDTAKYVMRFIGRHKSLWFIVKVLDKNND